MPEIKLVDGIEGIAKARNEAESSVIAEALKIGIAMLWKETILDKYLAGKISKKKAVKLVGERLVSMAEMQKKAVIEDIKWGISNA